MSVVACSRCRSRRQSRITGREPTNSSEPPRPHHQSRVFLQLGQVSVVPDPHRLTAVELVQACPDVITARLPQPGQGGR